MDSSEEIERASFDHHENELRSYDKNVLIAMIMQLGQFQQHSESMEEQVGKSKVQDMRWKNERDQLKKTIVGLKQEGQEKDRQRHQNEERLCAEYSQAMKMYNDAQANFLQAEKDRRQLLKTLAQRQGADIHKLDDAYFRNEIKNLRYMIRNWCRGQPIPLFSSQEGALDKTLRRLGDDKSESRYEFLRDLSPRYAEYIASPELFPWLLQTYIWDQLVRYVFEDNLWAGSIEPVEDGYPVDEQILIARSFGYFRAHFFPGIFTCNSCLKT